MPASATSLNDMLYEIRRIEKSREVLTENKIKAIYQNLIKELNSFVSETYVKYADGDGRLYVSSLDAQNKKAKFLQEVMKNVEGIAPDIQEEMEYLIDATYRDCYEGMIKALKESDTAGTLKEVGADLSVNQHVLKSAINNNISKLTLTPVLEKYRNDVVYKVSQELNLGLINGDRYESMAERIADSVGISYNKAMRIVRTESHRNIESGFMDCAENIQGKLDGTGLVYAATWRTRKDNRVRPQVVRKTKKGWKKGYSSNGADHVQMEEVTIKVGDMFNLSGGAKAKAPSQSGVAAHDCNCRCFLEYNLMTEEEFVKAGGKLSTTVKEKDLTKSEKSDIIKLPKSLENFDSYQEQWVEDNFSLPTKTKASLEKNIKTIIDNNAYSMRVSANDLDSIIDNGFQNQLQTAKSKGTLSAADRKTASYRLFNDDALNMKDSDFEKYGYLGSKDFVVDNEVSTTWQYGRTIVKFDKDRLEDRVTYTIDDSLGNALYNRVVGGKIGDSPTISGVPRDAVGDVVDRFKYAKNADFYDADTLAQEMDCRYWELQFHGDLTIDDVDSICFTGSEKASDELVDKLKSAGISVHKIVGGELIDL